MASGDQMPKLNLEKDKVDRTVIDYIKIVEAQNRARVEKLRRIRRNNLITAFGLGVGVLSIYGYSIYSVSQEKFLDDFERPAIKN
ncbi:unnamed protein product [Nezara viridula]|uniref:Cytochrome c oxidase assembly factor 3 n=1 Tax=Nezara viridula TaxID=85310 RepID=A0A9P0MPB5_NEZVI|nr:unnamed protein product [Nezara viridula]